MNIEHTPRMNGRIKSVVYYFIVHTAIRIFTSKRGIREKLIYISFQVSHVQVLLKKNLLRKILLGKNSLATRRLSSENI